MNAIRYNDPIYLAPRARRVALTWDADMPVAIREAVEPHVTAYAGFLPGWCVELLIAYTDEGSNRTSASMSARVEYRWARLTVHPCYLSQPVHDRAEIVLHEILHVQLEPMVDHAIECAQAVERVNAELGQTLANLRTHVLEQVVSDLTQAVLAHEPERPNPAIDSLTKLVNNIP